MFFYSRNRAGEHPLRHLAGYAGILPADAYAGFGESYDGKRKPGLITAAACWSHGRRHFFELADLRKAPLAVEAVQRIEEIFASERRINDFSAGDRLAAPTGQQADCRRPRNTDACRAHPAVAPRRDRPGHRLHADALADVLGRIADHPASPQRVELLPWHWKLRHDQAAAA